MKKYIVITTINPKSEGIKRFELMRDWKIILVGDQKSKPIESSGNLTFLSVEDQRGLGYQLVDVCPYNHYTRKNIGYLYAIQNGADVIYDTDDDNLPYRNWGLQHFTCNRKYKSDQRHVNIYKYFSHERIWPRGYPLDEIHNSGNSSIHIEKTTPVDIGVWQGLTDIEPDVDAIYRLTVNREVRFENKPPVALEKGYYCPFNSQNTFWNKKAFSYLYLPATTSFRFTDILRGYIAQTLLWKKSLHLGFTKATTYQLRNPHDLMKDFNDEVECYVNTKPIIGLIRSLTLRTDAFLNLEAIYKALSAHGFIKSDELPILQAWISDIKKLLADNRKRKIHAQ